MIMSENFSSRVKCVGETTSFDARALFFLLSADEVHPCLIARNFFVCLSSTPSQKIIPRAQHTTSCGSQRVLGLLIFTLLIGHKALSEALDIIINPVMEVCGSRGGGGGVLTPHFCRYVPRQSEKWARAPARAPGRA